MIRDSKAFTGVLTRIGSKAIEENVVLNFNLRHVEEGDMPSFLDSYEKKCEIQNIRCLFNYPIQWKTISLEASFRFRIEFDELTFEADLKGIKVKRTYKKGMESYIYDLEFEKEMEKDADLFLSTYLNQKEEDENGKKVLCKYSVYLTPLEIVVENIEPHHLEE